VQVSSGRGIRITSMPGRGESARPGTAEAALGRSVAPVGSHPIGPSVRPRASERAVDWAGLCLAGREAGRPFALPLRLWRRELERGVRPVRRRAADPGGVRASRGPLRGTWVGVRGYPSGYPSGLGLRRSRSPQHAAAHSLALALVHARTAAPPRAPGGCGHVARLFFLPSGARGAGAEQTSGRRHR
jgi:hypothetical protein